MVPLAVIKDEFPFHCFFDDAPKPLFKSQSYEEDMEIAEGCFRYVELDYHSVITNMAS